jgi:hypothetical protein
LHERSLKPDYRGNPPWPQQYRRTVSDSLASLRLACSSHTTKLAPQQARSSQYRSSDLGDLFMVNESPTSSICDFDTGAEQKGVYRHEKRRRGAVWKQSFDGAAGRRGRSLDAAHHWALAFSTRKDGRGVLLEYINIGLWQTLDQHELASELPHLEMI